MSNEQSTLEVEVADENPEKQESEKSPEERVVDRAVENYEPHPLAP